MNSMELSLDRSALLAGFAGTICAYLHGAVEGEMATSLTSG